MHEDCQEVLRNLETFLDGECPDSLETVLRVHLRDCPPCVDRAEFERELRILIASRCRETAPAGLVSRILQQLRAF